MLFAFIFTNEPERENIRVQYLSAHLDWFEANRDIIPIGGALMSDLGQTPSGGLWISHAKSKKKLEELLETDPFYINEVRRSYQIHHWIRTNRNRVVVL